MSTYINVTVGKAGLSDQAKQQTNANRQAKLEADARNKAEVDGKRQRDANRALQGIGPDGKPLYGQLLQATVRRDEPAAWRRTLGEDFGFIDVRGCNTGESADNYFKEKYQISTQRTISKCKVVRVVIGGAADACVGWDADPLEFFDGKTEELARLINSGGVVWINNEYSGCGIDASALNQFLADSFGATIGFVDNTEDGDREYVGPFTEYGAVRSELTYAAQADLAPPFFYTVFTCTITGGTSYYANAYGVVCAFEKIGSGFLVLSGDQNGTGQFPSYTDGDKNFIDALLALK